MKNTAALVTFLLWTLILPTPALACTGNALGMGAAILMGSGFLLALVVGLYLAVAGSGGSCDETTKHPPCGSRGSPPSKALEERRPRGRLVGLSRIILTLFWTIVLTPVCANIFLMLMALGA